MKILMVCLGNICRSPLAEGILKKKIQEKGLGWEVDSAGTSRWHLGEAPDPRSIATARNHQIDIQGQRARQLVHSDFKQFDKIIVMDESNYQAALLMAKNDTERNKVHRILDYVQETKEVDVMDPYWNDEAFEEVFSILDQACDQLLEAFLKEEKHK